MGGYKKRKNLKSAAKAKAKKAAAEALKVENEKVAEEKIRPIIEDEKVSEDDEVAEEKGIPIIKDDKVADVDDEVALEKVQAPTPVIHKKKSGLTKEKKKPIPLKDRKEKIRLFIREQMKKECMDSIDTKFVEEEGKMVQAKTVGLSKDSIFQDKVQYLTKVLTAGLSNVVIGIAEYHRQFQSGSERALMDIDIAKGEKLTDLRKLDQFVINRNANDLISHLDMVREGSYSFIN